MLWSQHSRNCLSQVQIQRILRLGFVGRAFWVLCSFDLFACLLMDILRRQQLKMEGSPSADICALLHVPFSLTFMGFIYFMVFSGAINPSGALLPTELRHNAFTSMISHPIWKTAVKRPSRQTRHDVSHDLLNFIDRATSKVIFRVT